MTSYISIKHQQYGRFSYLKAFPLILNDAVFKTAEIKTKMKV